MKFLVVGVVDLPNVLNAGFAILMGMKCGIM